MRHPETRVLMSLRRRTPRTRGFTLIELMITVAIVGILASVAYPSYKNSVLKGRRAEGRTALIDLAQQQERYLTQYGQYKTFAYGDSGVPFKMYSGDNATSPTYKLSATTCSSAVDIRSCVLLTAAPTRSDPDANNLTLTSTGIKSCDGGKASTAGVCW